MSAGFPPETPSTALLITTWNKPWALEKVLAGVALQRQPPEEVVVADDGSGPETKALIERWRKRLGPRLRHVWQENTGYRRARALNLAIAAATADYLVITDGDCVPPVDFIADHGRLAERGHFVQGGRCRVWEKHAAKFEPGDSRPWQWRLRGWMERRPNYWHWPRAWVSRNAATTLILGCNFAAWRDDVVRANGFDERFEGWGYEDSDLGFRLLNAGVKVKDVYGQAFTFHLDHPDSPRDRAAENRALRTETRQTGRVRAVQGLDQHTVLRPEGVNR